MALDNEKDRYRKAKAIANAVLDLPVERRSGQIRARCADDDALEKEVRWLIEAAEDASDDRVPERFQEAAQRALKNVSLNVPLPRDYQLVRRLNEGGMGVVYLAERTDGDLRQRVALKLLHLTTEPDAAQTRRFATERQILSRLSHPNIAHLIDGGLTADGRPFLATDYIDGERIDQWCRRQRCSIRERLELFLKVCGAVDYAHRHMVIHRDLKPSNILVTSEGEPKLLDFGIARLLDRPETPEPTTENNEQAMTLAYASPEQIQGEGLSAATDVYSLGVLLYELLTGKRPFDHIGSSHLLPAAILGGDITPPGQISGSDGYWLRRTVSRDLEAIVMKSLRREPEQRYTTVKELAEDLERLIEHRPVQARHGRFIYRVRRFSWRHRWGVAAGGLITALLLAFFVDREAQLTRIAWERDRAEAVTEFMNELFAGADSLPSRGNEVTVREILDLGTDQLAARDEYSPALLGSIHLAIGRAYNGLGLGEQALPLLREAQSALDSAISVSERARIQAQIGAALDSAGRAVEAIAADQRALDLFEKAGGGFTRPSLRVRIRKLRNHANVLDIPLERTIDELGDIIATLRDLPEPPQELLFEAQAARVGAFVFQRQTDLALEAAIEARDLAESLYGESDPRRLRGRYVHATALMLSDPEDAVAMYQDLIADHERLIGPSQRLANTIGNLGVALSRIGRNTDSMAAFSDAAAMIEQVAGRDHYLYRLSMANLAALHLRESEPERAESLVRVILAEQEQRVERFEGVEAVYRASALDTLASALTLQGRLAEAEAHYARALELLDDKAEASWPNLEPTIAAKLSEVRRERAGTPATD
jgi:serine/threonine-protein kinase